MALSTRTRKIIEVALADKTAASDLNTNLVAAGAPTPQAAIAAIAVTPTTGSLPVANGAITIDTAAPTVVALLEYCTELKASVDAIRAALTATGITL